MKYIYERQFLFVGDVGPYRWRYLLEVYSSVEEYSMERRKIFHISLKGTFIT